MSMLLLLLFGFFFGKNIQFDLEEIFFHSPATASATLQFSFFCRSNSNLPSRHIYLSNLLLTHTKKERNERNESSWLFFSMKAKNVYDNI